ncbi:hypothetical protein J6A31_02615 [bacterium]|nr:hypothetical protein [bacterium]
MAKRQGKVNPDAQVQTSQEVAKKAVYLNNLLDCSEKEIYSKDGPKKPLIGYGDGSFFARVPIDDKVWATFPIENENIQVSRKKADSEGKRAANVGKYDLKFDADTVVTARIREDGKDVYKELPISGIATYMNAPADKKLNAGWTKDIPNVDAPEKPTREKVDHSNDGFINGVKRYPSGVIYGENRPNGPKAYFDAYSNEHKLEIPVKKIDNGYQYGVIGVSNDMMFKSVKYNKDKSAPKEFISDTYNINLGDNDKMIDVTIRTPGSTDKETVSMRVGDISEAYNQWRDAHRNKSTEKAKEVENEKQVDAEFEDNDLECPV